MRIVFAGTPEFAARALESILAAGHDVPLVLTQPDRPAGRGMKLRMSPVKEVALRHGLPIAQPENLKTPESRAAIIDARPEVMVVAAYGLILPQVALDIPLLGCINIHASLLPRWRGAAPIQRAIEAGDAQTGVTLMQMEAGLDTGPMLSLHAVPIEPEDTAVSLHDKLAELGARAIVELLPELAEKQKRAQPQDVALATYAAKISKDEAQIDWPLPAIVLDRRIRAFNPFPGAFALLEGAPLKIWQARPIDAPPATASRPGQILALTPASLVVQCGAGALEISEVQKAGGKRLPVASFLAGNPLKPGDLLG